MIVNGKSRESLCGVLLDLTQPLSKQDICNKVKIKRKYFLVFLHIENDLILILRYLC